MIEQKGLNVIKVFLVEDEYIVREGIKHMNWEAFGLQFCGEEIRKRYRFLSRNIFRMQERPGKIHSFSVSIL